MNNRKSNHQKRNSNWKLAAAAFSLVGIGGMAFLGMSEAAMAKETALLERIPTVYQENETSTVAEPETAKSYEQAAFDVVMASWGKETPDAKDLSMEAAAQTGAQLLEEAYDLNLEGATIYMLYSSGTITFPRATWSGTVTYEGEPVPDMEKYSFTLDSVTGERFGFGYERKLETEVSLGAEKGLKDNCEDYKALARQLAEELHLIQGKISRIEYNCQGYSNNDPTVSFDVYGEKGEQANMTFSRYDKALLGVGYDACNRYPELTPDQITEDMLWQMEESEESAVLLN